MGNAYRYCTLTSKENIIKRKYGEQNYLANYLPYYAILH